MVHEPQIDNLINSLYLLALNLILSTLLAFIRNTWITFERIQT